MSARIEAYLYSSGTSGVLDATASITITEPGPTAYTATLAAPALFTDALTSWQALFNAAPSGLTGAYTFAWDTSAQAVTISATGIVSFAITWVGNTGAALGFSADTSGALTYTGDQQALSRFDDIRFSSGAIVNGDNVDLRDYTYGRHRSIVWGTADVWDSQLHVQSARSAEFLASYCVAGRVRVYQDESVLTAYSITNLSGYLDAYVIGMADHREKRGRTWLLCSISLAVPRS